MINVERRCSSVTGHQSPNSFCYKLADHTDSNFEKGGACLPVALLDVAYLIFASVACLGDVALAQVRL